MTTPPSSLPRASSSSSRLASQSPSASAALRAAAPRRLASTAAAPAAPRDAAFVQVSVGDEQSCALRRDGTLACWGSPRGGLLRPPEGQFLQASVSPAGGSACAVALKGHLECWGALYGPHGGQGRINGTFLQVAVGPLATCAVRAAGTLQCFGDERRLWRSAGAPAPTTPFVEVSAASAAGDAALCGVTAERVARVLCFGDVPSISAVPHDLEPAVQELLNFEL